MATDSAVVHPAGLGGKRAVRLRRLTYAAMTLSLLILAGLVVADGWRPVLGVDSRIVSAGAQDGSTLRAEVPAVARAGLAAPVAVEVTNPEGFDAPVEIAISRPWIEAWDLNGFVPEPSSETGDPQWWVLEFDPPPGTTLRVFLDVRLEPAHQESASGSIQLRRAGRVAAEVEFETVVRP